MIVPLRMLILAVVDAVIHDIGAEHSEHMIQLLCAGAAIRRIGKIGSCLHSVLCQQRLVGLSFLLLPLLGRCGELVLFFIHGVSSSVSSI